MPALAWALVCGLLFGIGVAVWIFYYRPKKDGTELWIPRAFAEYLNKRSKKATLAVEAFALGLTSGIAEIIFILPSLAIASLTLVGLEPIWQLAGVGFYSVIATLGLIIVWTMVGRGKSLAKIQKWRTKNKKFLQFAAGSALMALGFFVYVDKIISLVHGG